MKNRIGSKTAIVMVTVAVSLLSGACGQRGPLYLPSPGTENRDKGKSLDPVIPKRDPTER